MIQFFIDTDDAEVALLRLEEAVSPSSFCHFLAANVDPYLRKRADERFISEGDSASGKWAPLKKATQEMRTRYGFPPAHPINERTGQLRDHITSRDGQVSMIGPAAVLTLPGSGMEWITEQKIMTAQKGKSKPSTVARPVLALDSEDLAYVLTALLVDIVLKVEGPII